MIRTTNEGQESRPHNNVITANGIAPIEFAREVFRKINLYDDENLGKWFQSHFDLRFLARLEQSVVFQVMMHMQIKALFLITFLVLSIRLSAQEADRFAPIKFYPVDFTPVAVNSTMEDSLQLKGFQYPELYKTQDGRIFIGTHERQQPLAEVLERLKNPSASESRRPAPPMAPPPPPPGAPNTIPPAYRRNLDSKNIFQYSGPCAISYAKHYDRSHKQYIFANCGHPDFNLSAILAAFYGLELQREYYPPDANPRSRKAIADNVYFLELEDSMLVIWVKAYEIWGNYLSYDGQWLREEPKPLLQDVYYNYYNSAYRRVPFAVNNDISAHISDFDIRQDADHFYLTYNLDMYHPGNIENVRGGLVRILKLDRDLNIQISQQTPDTLSRDNRSLLDGWPSMELMVHDEGVMQLISIPPQLNNPEYLLLSCFDKDLNLVHEGQVILDSLSNYYHETPIEVVDDGFLITRKTFDEKTQILITQKIGYDGQVSQPYIVYNKAKNQRRVHAYQTKIIDDKIYYYILVSGWNVEPAIQVYTVDLDQFR